MSEITTRSRSKIAAGKQPAKAPSTDSSQDESQIRARISTRSTRAATDLGQSSKGGIGDSSHLSGPSHLRQQPQAARRVDEERENPEPNRQNAIGIRGQEKSKSTGSAPREHRDEAQPPPRRTASTASHARSDKSEPYHPIGEWVWVLHKREGPGGDDKLLDGEHHAAQVVFPARQDEQGKTKWLLTRPQ